jgi:hypothetical protein
MTAQKRRQLMDIEKKFFKDAEKYFQRNESDDEID